MTKKSNKDRSATAYMPTAGLIRTMVKELSNGYEGRILLMGVGLCNLIQEYEEENELHGRSIENIDAIESNDKLCGVLEKSGVCIVSDSLESFETMTRYDCILAISKYYDLSELDRMAKFVQPRGTLIAIGGDKFEAYRNKIKREYKDWNPSIDKISNGFKAGKHNKEAWSIRMTRPMLEESDSVLLKNIKEDVHIDALFRCLTLHDEADELQVMIYQCVRDQMAGFALMQDYEAMFPCLVDSVRPRVDGDTAAHVVGSPLIKMGTTPNQFVEGIRRKYWRYIFLCDDHLAGLPSGIEHHVRKYVNGLGRYDFNGSSIRRFRGELCQKTEVWIKEELETLFNELSGIQDQYSMVNKANVIPFDGYQTEEAWRIKNKVTISLDGIQKYLSGNIYFSAKQKICDMERLLDYLAVTNPDSSTRELLDQAEKQGQTRGITLRHIKVSFFLKGTTCIEFLDPVLLEKFNVFVCLRKDWLPPDYGKAVYGNFDSKSRAVIDSFQGEDAYKSCLNWPSCDRLHSLPMFHLSGLE